MFFFGFKWLLSIPRTEVYAIVVLMKEVEKLLEAETFYEKSRVQLYQAFTRTWLDRKVRLSFAVFFKLIHSANFARFCRSLLDKYGTCLPRFDGPIGNWTARNTWLIGAFTESLAVDECFTRN